ncbi:hypothetical protein [Streptomyces sp. NPDC019793]|uniref:hypothetical protein n=1 Tax=unclassified Streptomyces TaxID=2593676 RepID=UPI0033C65FDF
MNIVHARLWQTKVSIGSDGLAEVVTATEVGRGPLPVSLSQLVGINALACDLRGVIDEGVHDHEVNLLTSYVAERKNGTPLTANYPRLTATSRHTRSFVSECTGLGVMSAVSEALFEWKPNKRSLNSFDVLPRQLVGVYGRTGPRPDLLFHLNAGLIAGEARGRSRKEKSLFPTTATKPQKDRILTLANWSIRHTEHPYFMSWVWIGPSGVVVDVFLPESEKATDNITTEWMKTTQDELWVISSERSRRRPLTRLATDFSDDGTRQGGDTFLARSRSIRVSAGTVRRIMEESATQAEARADAVMQERFERTPIVGSLADIPVRGKWIRADALGPATHEVLVGVLGEVVSAEGRAQRRRRSQGVDAALDGRLLTVVHRLGEERPSWDRIERDLLSAP